MPAIKGKIQKGLGEGQNTVREQMPYFKECFPEAGICQPGTINILLEQPLVVITPDFTTRPLPWHPAFRVMKGGEIFQFVRIRLTVTGCQPVNAWIYRAQFSPYRDNPFYIEVIAPKIGFTGIPDCTVEVLSGCHAGIVVIGDAQIEKSRESAPGAK